ncbi:D-alanyl-D-alanine carboxypeptidase family protein [Calderihabitans maritimus]|uniref:D-alanyl-D-alanine carboxypeptidase family protein n=1 Tax=Calderihabitans maritimus TaxID=1246530 RepID=UPI000B5066F1|nr:D-alanyl-D-alanine carboxypeptidase family protein [Calderihabitans maritimus]
MKLVKPFVAAILGTIILLSLVPAVFAQPEITGSTGLLVDMETGKVLYEKNARKRVAPASTTKILTALIALEKGYLNDLVTVSERATQVEGTIVWLQPGEKQPLENLLYAMMLNSANDAALAIAEHIGGTVEEFVQMMNEKAKELGATASHFANPHGLPAPDHYTTAYDMALIARAAMENPKFREIVGTKTRPWRGQSWESQLLNLNKLLNYYEGANGIKTGYTSEAGWCLVASAKREDQEFLTLVFNSTSDKVWKDAEELLDYGFENFRKFQLIEAGDIIAEVNVGRGDTVKVVAKNSFHYLLPKDSKLVPQQKIELSQVLRPVQAGQEVGKIIYFLGEEKIGEVPLIAQNRVKKLVTFRDWWFRVTFVMLVLWVLNLLRRTLVNRRRHSRLYGSRRYRYRIRY